MFRKIVLYVFISIVLTTIGVFAYKQVNVRIVETKADIELLTLNEMENRSDIIIKGSLSGVIKQQLKYGEDGLPIYWETATEVVVTKIFKNDIGIKLGDSIIVVEPYAIWRNPGGAFMLVTEGYRPLSKNNEYILFLVAWNDRYQIIGNVQGKHLVHLLSEPLTRDLLEVGDIDSHYIQLHEEVAENYFSDS